MQAKRYLNMKSVWKTTWLPITRDVMAQTRTGQLQSIEGTCNSLRAVLGVTGVYIEEKVVEYTIKPLNTVLNERRQAVLNSIKHTKKNCLLCAVLKSGGLQFVYILCASKVAVLCSVILRLNCIADRGCPRPANTFLKSRMLFSPGLDFYCSVSVCRSSSRRINCLGYL